MPSYGLYADALVLLQHSKKVFGSNVGPLVRTSSGYSDFLPQFKDTQDNWQLIDVNVCLALHYPFYTKTTEYKQILKMCAHLLKR